MRRPIWIFVVLLLLLVSGAALAAGPPAAVLDEIEAGFRAHRLGDYKEAVQHYTNVIRTRELRAWDRSVAYLLRGEAFQDSGDPDRAIADFSRAIKIRPQYAQAFFFRGLCYQQKGDLEKAYQDIRQAISYKPEKEIYQRKIEEVKAELEKQGRPVPKD